MDERDVVAEIFSEDLARLLRKAVLDERERCIKIVANWFGDHHTSPGYDAIREMRGGDA